MISGGRRDGLKLQSLTLVWVGQLTKSRLTEEEMTGFLNDKKNQGIIIEVKEEINLNEVFSKYGKKISEQRSNLN